METPARTFVKSLTWQGMGLVTMSLLGYLVTGSLGAASGLAAMSAVFSVGTFYLHERLWARVRWGLRHGDRG